MGTAELVPAARGSAAAGVAGPAAGLEQSAEAQAWRDFYIAVLESEGCRFGLVVDDLKAPEEIVVKPLSAALREIGVFSGATVLGNGTLAMILDVAATGARAGVRPVAEAVMARWSRNRAVRCSGTAESEMETLDGDLRSMEAQASGRAARGSDGDAVERGGAD
jgi:hypothetical protein